MLAKELGSCRLLLLLQLLIHLHRQFHSIGIDPVQIQAPPVRNRTIPVLRGLEKGNKASSFRNYDILDPDQIDSGDGWSSTLAIEIGWRWSGKVKVIRNNQHNVGNENGGGFSPNYVLVSIQSLTPSSGQPKADRHVWNKATPTPDIPIKSSL